MRQKKLKYLASDAWLLLSIILAAGNDKASLEEIVAVGDGINVAIFTADEMESGLYRLRASGYIEEIDEGFKPTDLALNKYQEISKKKKGLLNQLELLRVAIGAEPWIIGGGPHPHPENRFKYPGFTKKRFSEAVKYYGDNASKIFKELKKKRG
jgi:hypothetical protein